MRERGYADEYLLKNQIQSYIYREELKVFGCYDELRIGKSLRTLFGKYKRLLLEIVEP